MGQAAKHSLLCAVFMASASTERIMRAVRFLLFSFFAFKLLISIICDVAMRANFMSKYKKLPIFIEFLFYWVDQWEQLQLILTLFPVANLYQILFIIFHQIIIWCLFEFYFNTNEFALKYIVQVYIKLVKNALLLP